MIFQNQQANILRVNGALADNFANRPASQGTYYIFYSLDTQEIFYDDVSGWIKLGSGGGGGGVNIYNSDGTLTGNRTLSGANKDLNFFNLKRFVLFTQNQFSFANFDSNNEITFTGQPNFEGLIKFTDYNNSALNTSFIVGNSTIKTQYGSLNNDIGLKLDFANNIYKLGDYNGNILYDTNVTVDSTNSFVSIRGNGSGTEFLLDDFNQIIKTSNQGNDIGLKLDFANSVYQFGQLNGGNQTYLEIADTNKVIFAFHNGNANGLQINFNNRSYSFGDYNNINSDGFLGISQKLVQLVAGNIIRPSIILNGNNNIISSQFSNVDNGFQLDNNNRTYQFGQINSGGGTRLSINDNQRLISTTSTSNPNSGISLNLNTSNYRIGNAPLVGNRTFFSIDDNNQIIFTSNGINGINGINFTFASRNYQFGHINGFNRTHLVVDDTAQRFYSINNANVNGIDLRFNNQIYIFGQQTGTNPVYFSINNNLKQLTTFYNNIPNGINFDYTTNIYQFGNTSLGFFQITNNILSFLNCNQLVFAGSLTTGTSGPASGQHLKVTINSIDYVIELKQP